MKNLTNSGSRFVIAEEWMRRVLFCTFFISASAAAETNSVSVPIEIVKEDFDAVAIYAPCTFDSFKTKCHIDTGMRQSEINDKQFSSYPAVRTSESKDVSGKGAVCKEILVKKLSFQNKSQEKALVRDCGQERLHQAVIGIDFFSVERFKLSISKKILEFATPEITEGSAFLKLHDNYLALPVGIGKSSFLGLFDTGAGLTVIDEGLLKKHKNQIVVHSETTVHTPNGDLKAKIYKILSLKIADRVVTDILCVAMPFKSMKSTFGTDVQMIIGNNFIGRFDWQVDALNRRYLLSN